VTARDGVGACGERRRTTTSAAAERAINPLGSGTAVNV